MMKKRWLFSAILGASVAILAACSSDDPVSTASASDQDRILQYQGTPGSVSFTELAEALGYFGDLQQVKQILVTHSMGLSLNHMQKGSKLNQL